MGFGVVKFVATTRRWYDKRVLVLFERCRRCDTCQNPYLRKEKINVSKSIYKSVIVCYNISRVEIVVSLDVNVIYTRRVKYDRFTSIYM